LSKLGANGCDIRRTYDNFLYLITKVKLAMCSRRGGK